MDRETQISAPISRQTKEMLEKYVRATGIKKGRLVDEALQHYLQALNELPADVIVHTRIVLSASSFERLTRRLARKSKPTAALRKLMRDGD